MKWFLKALKQYANFRGRARRREWWLFYFFANLPTFLLVVAAVLVPSLLEKPENSNEGIVIVFGILVLLLLLYGLALLVPTVAVTVRRFHDVGLSGWFLLAPVVPFLLLSLDSVDLFFYSMLGLQLGFLVVTLMDSQPGTNKYGPDPKGDRISAPTHKPTEQRRSNQVSGSSSGYDWTLEGINPEPDAPPSIRLNLGSEALRRRCILGRKAEAVDFLLPNTSVSGRHAQMWEDQGSLLLEDLDSSNGTRINGAGLAPHQPAEIFEGDQIEFGEVRLTLRRK